METHTKEFKQSSCAWFFRNVKTVMNILGALSLLSGVNILCETHTGDLVSSNSSFELNMSKILTDVNGNIKLIAGLVIYEQQPY